MPTTKVFIEWDTPDYEGWLAPDNIATALHAYCQNTEFTVTRFSGNDESYRFACSQLIHWIDGMENGWLEKQASALRECYVSAKAAEQGVHPTPPTSRTDIALGMADVILKKQRARKSAGG